MKVPSNGGAFCYKLSNALDSNRSRFALLPHLVAKTVPRNRGDEIAVLEAIPPGVRLFPNLLIVKKEIPSIVSAFFARRNTPFVFR